MDRRAREGKGVSEGQPLRPWCPLVSLDPFGGSHLVRFLSYSFLLFPFLFLRSMPPFAFDSSPLVLLGDSFLFSALVVPLHRFLFCLSFLSFLGRHRTEDTERTRASSYS